MPRSLVVVVAAVSIFFSMFFGDFSYPEYFIARSGGNTFINVNGIELAYGYDDFHIIMYVRLSIISSTQNLNNSTAAIRRRP